MLLEFLLFCSVKFYFFYSLDTHLALILYSCEKHHFQFIDDEI